VEEGWRRKAIGWTRGDPPPGFLNKSAETIEDAGDRRDMRNERVRKLLKRKSGDWERRAKEAVMKLERGEGAGERVRGTRANMRDFLAE
jgi:hypothetical protein